MYRPRLTVSVALATFNGGKYIGLQLDSIAAQTCPPDEIVVGDDQSSDNTLEIIEEFSKNTGLKVRIHKNANRLGTAKNFENIISRCNSEIIVFSDQDDIWREDKLDKIIGSFLQNPDAPYVFSDGLLLDESGNLIGGSVWGHAHFLEEEQALYRVGRGFEVLLRHNVILGCTMAIRRSAAVYALPIETVLLYHDYWISVALESIASGVYIDEPLISYRLHPAQQAGFFKLSGDAIKRALLERNEVYYTREAEAFRRIKTLFETNGASSTHLEAIDAKIKFSEIRASMRQNPFMAPFRIASSFWKGDYGRFTLKLNVAGQDLPAAIMLDVVGSVLSPLIQRMGWGREY